MRRISLTALARQLPLLCGIGAYLTVMARSGGVLADPDTYWHIAVGRWIVAHGAVPRHDVFSYTFQGAPWVPHEWLADVLIGWTYDQFRWGGLIAMTAIAFGAAIALLVHHLLKYMPPAYALIGALGAWGMCLPHLFARPHVLTLAVLVAWTANLVAARDAGRAPSPAAALLMLLWANLHGGYMFGLGLAAMLGAEAVFEADGWRPALASALRWGGFGALSLVAALATPNGLSGLLLPLRLLGMQTVMSSIGEWRGPDFQQPQPFEAWLLLVLLVALTRGVRLPITRVVMLLVLVHLALTHLRNAELVGLAAPLLVARGLAPAGARTPVRAPATIALAAAGAFVVATAIAAARFDAAQDPARYAPTEAVAFVEARGAPGRVLNAYEFGGYLIFKGIPTSIDGRADMYGDAFFRRYHDLAALPSLIAQYDVAWTLYEPQDPHVVLLDHLAGWRRVYADAKAVVHMRDDGAPPN
ncbi:MAG: hypothetical protein ACLPSW_35165 [Roseiarcus sp.]